MNTCASSLRARVFLCGVALLVFSYIICASLDAKEEIVLDLYNKKKKKYLRKLTTFSRMDVVIGGGPWTMLVFPSKKKVNNELLEPQ